MPKGKGKKAIQKNKKLTKARPKLNIPDSVDIQNCEKCPSLS